MENKLKHKSNQLAILLLLIVATAFTSLNTLDEVVMNLRKGNAVQIADNFDKTVDLTLPGKSGSYDKETATLLLKDFFQKRSIRDFDVLHQGNQPQAKFCIGNLFTGSGNFRTTVYIKHKAGRFLLQEIRFETIR